MDLDLVPSQPVVDEEKLRRDPDNELFIATFNFLAKQVYQNAVNKGFWEHDFGEVTDAQRIALIHAEISEALESIRKNHPKSEKISEFTETEEEFADCIIRIMELAGKRGYKVSEAVVAKMKYNLNRPYKHEKKF